MRESCNAMVDACSVQAAYLRNVLGERRHRLSKMPRHTIVSRRVLQRAAVGQLVRRWQHRQARILIAEKQSNVRIQVVRRE